VQKSEGKRELERPRHRWENIKINLKRNTRRDVMAYIGIGTSNGF
jgi:hypothetical protein